MVSLRARPNPPRMSDSPESVIRGAVLMPYLSDSGEYDIRRRFSLCVSVAPELDK